MKELTFLSIRGNTIPSDMKGIMQAYNELVPDASFSVLSKNIDLEGKEKESRATCKKIIKTVGNAISIDGLVDDNYWAKEKKGTRILLLLPFDYLYQDITNSEFMNQVVSGFDYVVVIGNQLMSILPDGEWKEKLISSEAYDLPFIDKIKDITIGHEIQKRFVEKYPVCNEKKIIAFIVKSKKEIEERFEEIDLEEMIKQLPENSVFVTNSETLFDKSSCLGQESISQFVYSKRLFTEHEMLLMADSVITDDAFIWNCCKEAGKSVYYYPCTETLFKIYMDKAEANKPSENLNTYLKEIQNNAGLMSVAAGMTKPLREAFEQILKLERNNHE